MNRNTEVLLLATSVISIASAIYISANYICSAGDMLTLLAGVFAINFFLYKVFTGWLFINLNVTADTLRKIATDGNDHLTVKVILSKGSTDSVWLHDIEIRLRSIEKTKNSINYLNEQVINPTNFHKLQIYEDKYWNEDGSEWYVISSAEEASFTAYTKVRSGDVISVEIVVLGTRPFYGILQKPQLSQWRSSLIILPI